MTLVWVYSTFLRRLSGYLFCEKMPEEPHFIHGHDRNRLKVHAEPLTVLKIPSAIAERGISGRFADQDRHEFANRIRLH